ncbi:MAG: hypothetical protein IT306_10820 [Chloroflexi bacterium]|nr:hypothetical protein [Chloroflexota bacterium]
MVECGLPRYGLRLARHRRWQPERRVDLRLGRTPAALLPLALAPTPGGGTDRPRRTALGEHGTLVGHHDSRDRCRLHHGPGLASAGAGWLQRLVPPDPEMMLQYRRVWPDQQRRIGKQLVGVDVAAVGRTAEPGGKALGSLGEPGLRGQAAVGIVPEEPELHDALLGAGGRRSGS